MLSADLKEVASPCKEPEPQLHTHVLLYLCIQYHGQLLTLGTCVLHYPGGDSDMTMAVLSSDGVTAFLAGTSHTSWPS